MNDEELETQKRLTLNWLIQGAAQHAGMTFHHLVRDELNALEPELLPLYDQYALINLLQYWQLEAKLLFGSPTRFWRGAEANPNHPFHGHPLVKGTAELICLHGLCQLPDDIYHRVIQLTDRLDLEPWMLQSGGELWRLLLAALPDDRSIAHVFMHLARLPAEELQSIIADVITQSESASRRLAELTGTTGQEL